MSDPLDRLRASNPVPVPSADPDDPRARATLEEILMTDVHDTTTTDAPSAGTPGPDDHRPSRVVRGPWFRNPRLLAAAAAALLLVGVVGTSTLDDGTDDVPVDAALPTNPDAEADVGDTDLFPGDEPDLGADPDFGATEVTSCVEMYSLETLANRDHAFDGTVTSVDGDRMTFEVDEWFTDDQGGSITLDHQGYAGMLFSPDGPALEPGTRVLVAGDDDFVWSCGFTQLHSPELAAEWRAALGG